MDIDADRKKQYEAHTRFRRWEEVFRMALVGAAAGSRQTSLVISDAVDIADAALVEISKREPPEPER